MRQKKGVILLITVGFITAITALIAYQFSVTDKGLKRTAEEKFYYQSALILSDVNQKLIPELLKELKSLDANNSDSKNLIADYLSAYYDLPFPVVNDESLGTVVVTISPADTKFNINLLKNIKDEDREFFRFFIQELEDRMLLIDLIDLALETNSSISTAYEYLKNDGSIEINSIFFRKGEIVDMEQFEVILNSYYKISKDKKVFELNWDKFIDFSSFDKVSFSSISYEFCKAGFFDKGSDWIDSYCKNEERKYFEKDEVLPDDDDNITLNRYNITFEKYSPIIEVNIDISQNENSSNFRFFYNIEKSASFGLKINMQQGKI